MYQRQQPRYSTTTTSVATAPLLGQVLGITGGGFLVTAVTSYLTLGFPQGAALVAMLVGFGFLLAIGATRRNPALSMLMYYAFTACEGIGLGPTIQRYIAVDGSGVVVNAAATTGLGMLVLGAVAYLTSIDFRRFSGIATGALLVLIIAGIVSAFTHFLHPAVYAWLTLAIFSLLVLVDFSRIRAGGSGATAIELATSIYLDSINIFLALLSIFGGRSRDD